ncbi:hypothetical protein CEXT_434061 [Caerostris extrusa]|uniref:Uncharacterized protein n=1 Tax=Caerostris extrusa TaxID=172846 RepID=A0AAV4XXU7_CAEEX|nr:hypothetical protein CEXT_434061 [Caerostris extrusa]
MKRTLQRCWSRYRGFVFPADGLIGAVRNRWPREIIYGVREDLIKWSGRVTLQFVRDPQPIPDDGRPEDCPKNAAVDKEIQYGSHIGDIGARKAIYSGVN